MYFKRIINNDYIIDKRRLLPIILMATFREGNLILR